MAVGLQETLSQEPQSKEQDLLILAKIRGRSVEDIRKDDELLLAQMSEISTRNADGGTPKGYPPISPTDPLPYDARDEAESFTCRASILGSTNFTIDVNRSGNTDLAAKTKSLADEFRSYEGTISANIQASGRIEVVTEKDSWAHKEFSIIAAGQSRSR